MTLVDTAPPAEDKRWRMVEATMRRNGYRPDALIETLHTAQEAFGFLDDDTMLRISDALGVARSQVYGVATFYHFFQLKPQGRHTCAVCTGTACYINGADRLLQRVEAEYGIKPGETTDDDQLSLLTVRCVGACGLAPAVVMDGKVIGHMDPDELSARLKERSDDHV